MVAAGDDAFSTIDPGRTHIVANSYVAPTAQFVRNPDAAPDGASLLQHFAGAGALSTLDAHAIALRFLGESTAANVLMLGYAWQKGLVPVSLAALMRAIELHRIAVEMNKKALLLGRLAAADQGALARLADRTNKAGHSVVHFEAPASLDALLEVRQRELTRYQNARYAERYVGLVRRVEQREVELEGEASPRALARAVARNLYKVMAYKDEYEVARLYSDAAFRAGLAQEFGSQVKLGLQLAPPWMTALRGRAAPPRKVELGSWIFPLLKVLARGRSLRGTPFDLFGYTRERREEAALRDDYIGTLERWLPRLTAGNKALVLQWARLPDAVRGFGHVKRAALERLRVQEKELMARFDSAA
ncbi:MAG: DUF6537 domain-containing protein [Gammaproteobacteria bacterium]